MTKLIVVISKLIVLSFLTLFHLGDAMAGNLERSKEFFDKLSISKIELVDGFYDKEAVFQDPIHQLKGVLAIKSYYEGLYKNVDSIRFEYGDSMESGESGKIVSLTWRMYLKSGAINSGNEITVDGISLITFGGSEGKAIAHRDYFDMGEFVYERIPILKNIIRYIKNRMAGS